MEKVTATSGIFYNVDSFQNYILKCEKLKSDIALKTKDIRFLQQLLDRYFDKIVQNENLDEVRESLMRFQDLCYNCSRLKKRIKDHQRRLVEMLKGDIKHNPKALVKEQTWIEKRKALLTHDFISIEKEILVIADNVIQKDKDSRNQTIYS